MDIFRILYLLLAKKVTSILKDNDWFIISRQTTSSSKPYESFAITKQALVAEIIANVPIPPEKLYKKYVALLDQKNADAPTSTVLENELSGAITYTRAGDFPGHYIGTLAGAFADEFKFWKFIEDPGGGSSAVIFWVDTNKFEIYCYDNGNANSDGVLYRQSIEIRVYN